VFSNASKTSKRGHLALVKINDRFETVRRAPTQRIDGDLLVPVFRDGELLVDVDFDGIRARAAAGLVQLSHPCFAL
jgi:hypothetical protein